MRHLKARILALVIIVVFAGLIYFSWRQLKTEGRYSLKLAAFAPVGVVGGLFLLFFPGKAGKPETTTDKIIFLLVFGIGLLLGLGNWYLMDPGFFTFLQVKVRTVHVNDPAVHTSTYGVHISTRTVHTGACVVHVSGTRYKINISSLRD